MEEGRPTVLTGANGTGKSTILRLVNAVSAGDMDALLRAPLQRFELRFEAMPPFILTKTSDTNAIALEWGEQTATVVLASFSDFPDWVREAIDHARSGDDEDISEALIESAQANNVPYPTYQTVRDQLKDPRSDGERPMLPSGSPN
jgi:ABC-type molybdenum transport system ATPase subunit/photorepair protein PhrA